MGRTQYMLKGLKQLKEINSSFSSFVDFLYQYEVFSYLNSLKDTLRPSSLKCRTALHWPLNNTNGIKTFTFTIANKKFIHNFYVIKDSVKPIILAMAFFSKMSKFDFNTTNFKINNSTLANIEIFLLSPLRQIEIKNYLQRQRRHCR